MVRTTEPAMITWQGGQAPYYVSLIPGVLFVLFSFAHLLTATSRSTICGSRRSYVAY